MSDTFEPHVIRVGALDMQVCVPGDWDDTQVVEFAESNFSCGTTAGWQVRKAGNQYLAGDPERQKCAERSGFVHIMLDA